MVQMRYKTFQKTSGLGLIVALNGTSEAEAYLYNGAYYILWKVIFMAGDGAIQIEDQ
jgi:hypothetical protein